MTYLLRALLVAAACVLPAAQTCAADSAADNDAGAGGGLALADAVALALEGSDPYLEGPRARAAALEDRAVSDSQLPDPTVRLTVANLPTDTFSFTREPMTQMQLGVTQAFPRGAVRSLNREKRQIEAGGARSEAALRRREITLEVRRAWLDLRYLHSARASVGKSRLAVEELISVVQANFAVGGNMSQDIFHAQMELGLLDDRLLELEQQAAKARAGLQRWVGDAASVAPTGMPGLKHPSPQAAIATSLEDHPMLAMQAAKAAAAGQDVAIAGEAYKPGWALSLGYGRRGADRADFTSVGVSMDVPLFTGKRQDKRLSAAKRMAQAATLAKDATLLDMRRHLATVYADWQQLAERIALYEQVVQQRAQDTADASLNSYQSGVTDFPELIRARLALLQTELKLLMLDRDKYKAQAELLYLEGEDDA
jgi:outer membrane protein TolC